MPLFVLCLELTYFATNATLRRILNDQVELLLRRVINDFVKFADEGMVELLHDCHLCLDAIISAGAESDGLSLQSTFVHDLHSVILCRLNIVADEDL